MVYLLKDEGIAQRVFIEITFYLIHAIELTGKGLPVKRLSQATYQKNRTMPCAVSTLGDLVFCVVGKQRATGVGSPSG